MTSTATAAATTTPAATAAPDDTVRKLAELIVTTGANVQPGQIVAVASELGKEPLTRQIAAAAYRHGAAFVEVSYVDPHIKRARVVNADPQTLETFPSWFSHRMLELGRQQCARIGLSGPTEPHLLDDLDPQLVGREQSSPRREALQVMNDRTTNWSISPCPTPDWAALVFPQLEPAEALAKLWEQIAHVCRLDVDDPAAAWTARMRELEGAAGRLSERAFDAIRFEGPGTNLTVGMLPTHRFMTGGSATTSWGVHHMPNLPSEEIFTSPDPQRVDGVVRSTKPLFVYGVIIEGLEVEFREGRAVRIDAAQNVDVLRALAARDEGAAMLGEVALVDGEGRIGPLGTVFFDTLLDENAASHIALGRGFDFAVDEAHQDRVNKSEIHIDFMIGSPEVSVVGIDAAGGETPVLVEGGWRI